MAYNPSGGPEGANYYNGGGQQAPNNGYYQQQQPPQQYNQQPYTEGQYGQPPPGGPQQNYNQNYGEKPMFEQQFKIEKPKWNDLWAGILVRLLAHSSLAPAVELRRFDS